MCGGLRLQPERASGVDHAERPGQRPEVRQPCFARDAISAVPRGADAISAVPRGADAISRGSFGVLQDGRQIATAKASPSGVNTFAPKGLTPSAAANSYFSVVPLSSSGSPAGPASNSVPLASYPAGSGAGPASPADMAPSNLQLTSSPGLFSSSGRLSWSPPRVGRPASYMVIGDGKVLGTVPASETSFDVSPKSGEPGSVYQVAPVASNGAVGPASNTATSGSGPAPAYSGAGAPGYGTAGAGPYAASTAAARLRHPLVEAPGLGSPASFTVLKDGKPVASVAGNQTSVPVPGLPTNGGASALQVVPFDSNGVAGPASAPLAASLPSDPSSGIALTSTPAGSGSSPSALLAWTTPSGLGNVPSFGVLQDGRQIATAKASPSGVNTFAPKGLTRARPPTRTSRWCRCRRRAARGPRQQQRAARIVPGRLRRGPREPRGHGAVEPAADQLAGPLQLVGPPLVEPAARGRPASYMVIGDGKVLGTVPASETSFDVSPKSGEPGSVYQVAPVASNGAVGPASNTATSGSGPRPPTVARVRLATAPLALAPTVPRPARRGHPWLGRGRAGPEPLAPSSLALSSFNGSGPGSATLSWKRPASGSPASFTVLKDGKPVASVAGNQTSVPVPGLPTNGGASALQVVPFDSNGVAGPASAPLAASLPSDPSSGIALTSTPAGSGSSPSALLAWTTPSGLGNVPSFGVLQDGRQIATAKASPSGVNTFAPKGLTPSAAANSYFSVVPLSSSGSPAGPASNSVPLASYPAGSGAGPASPADMAPSNLQLTSSPGLFGSSGRLSWSPPRVGRPASYMVIGDGKVLGTVPASETSFDVSPKSGEPGSVYQVAPVASNGAVGPASSPSARQRRRIRLRTGPVRRRCPGAGIAGSGVDAPARAPRPVEPRPQQLQRQRPGSATLSWKRPASGSPASYTVLKDGKPVASVAGNQTSVPSRACRPTAAPRPCRCDPSSGIALTSTPAGSGSSPSALLAWTTPSGLGNVPSFGVLQDGRQIATAKASPSGVNTFAPKGLTPSAAANSNFSVVPLSSSGSPAGPASNSVPLASYPAGAGAGPASPADMAPSNLQLTSSPGLFGSSGRLSWSRPRVGRPASYMVIGDGKWLGPRARYSGAGAPGYGTAGAGPYGPSSGPARASLARAWTRRPEPLAPSSLALSSFNGSGPGSATLSWKRPASGSPASYTVLKDGKPVASVVPFDSNGVAGPASAPLAASLPRDPSSGIALTSTPAGSGSSPSALLAWTTPSGLGNVPSFGVLQDGRQIATAKASPSGVNTFAPKASPRARPPTRTSRCVPLASYPAGSGAGPASPADMAPSNLQLTSSPGLFGSSGRLSWSRPRVGRPASYMVIGDGKVLGTVPASETSFDVSPKSGEPGSVYQVAPVASNARSARPRAPSAAAAAPDPASDRARTPALVWPLWPGRRLVWARDLAVPRPAGLGSGSFAGGFGPSSPSSPGAGIAGSGVDAPAPSPLAPSSLALSSFNGSGPGSATLSWKRPASGSPASYTVLKDGKPVASVAGNQTSVPVPGLPTNGGASALQVVPFDSNGVAGPASAPLAASLPSDPSSGIALTSTPAGSGSSPSALLAWTTPSGLGNVPSFGVLQDGRQVATAKASPSGVNTFAPKGLTPSAAANSYFSVVPLSSSGSPRAPPATACRSPPDQLAGLFGSSGRLSWSRPRVGRPASYMVIGDGKVLGTVPASETSFDVSPKSGEPGSVYQVAPVASNGAVGPSSNTATSGSGPAPAYSGAGAPGYGTAGAGPYGPSSGPGAGIAGSGVDAPAPSPLAPSSLALSSFNGSGPGSATLSWKRPASARPPRGAVRQQRRRGPRLGSARGVAAERPELRHRADVDAGGLRLQPSALLAWTTPSGLGNVPSFGVLQDGRQMQIATAKASPSGVNTFAPKGLTPSAAANSYFSVVPLSSSGSPAGPASNSVPLASYPAGSGAGPASPADMAPSNLQLTSSPGLFGSSGRLSWSRPRAGSPASYMVIGDGFTPRFLRMQKT
eukprot:tig00021108_g18339.t1